MVWIGDCVCRGGELERKKARDDGETESGAHYPHFGLSMKKLLDFVLLALQRTLGAKQAEVLLDRVLRRHSSSDATLLIRVGQYHHHLCHVHIFLNPSLVLRRCRKTVRHLDINFFL